MFVPVKSSFDGGIDTGDIPASLRFRSAASASLSKTFTPNRQTFTISLWCKKSALNTYMNLFGFSNTYTLAQWGTTGSGSDILQFYGDNNAMSYVMSGVHRDPTSWMHIVMVANTTSATSTERFKVYINGNQVTAWSSSSAPAQNANLLPSGATLYFGQRGGSPAGYFDGYLSRVCFVDGQALNPSSFGYLNTDINEYVSKSQSDVKAVVDAGGTNSFMLDFDDASSTTTLGYDKSSKGNNWTLNNISLTAGVTYDHMLDVPGDSALTFDPLGGTTSNVTGYGWTASDGNLKWVVTNGSGYNNMITGSISVASGKYYIEFAPTGTPTSGWPAIGLIYSASISTAQNVSNLQTATYLSEYRLTDGQKSVFGSTGWAAYGSAIGAGGRGCIAIDADAGKVYWGSISGTTITWFGSGDPAAGTNAGDTFTAGTEVTLFADSYNSAGGFYITAGSQPFVATNIPTGFLALCQANLETPAILNPREHFDAKTSTGNGSGTRTYNGYLFAPGAVLTKARDGGASDWSFMDIVRGFDSAKQLYTNLTAAEGTYNYGYIDTQNADGFTLGASGAYYNSNGVNYVDWAWKAGGAGVSNTAGSITSTVSANAEAGFSIVRVPSGTAANGTVGHGLGGTPELIIGRNIDIVAAWRVWHKSLSSGYTLYFDTSAQTSAPTDWNSQTTLNSTVFSVGSNNGVNGSGQESIFYAFRSIPGYSKIGSYVGNSSTDGVYVHTGFRPRWVLVKEVTLGSEHWFIFDGVRDTYNRVDHRLMPNLSSAEDQVIPFADFTSQGFKLRPSSSYYNQVCATGVTYVYYAIADVAGKFSLAR